jgi:hypothetical protein
MTRSDEDRLALWYLDPEARVILRLFLGTTWPGGGPVRRLTPADELESRRWAANLLRSVGPPLALTSLLLPSRRERRSALLREVCNQLANQIDPDCKSRRKIHFTKVRGRLPEIHLQRPIVESVRRLVEKGVTVEEACARVADQYQLSESWISKLWASLGPRRRNRRPKRMNRRGTSL